VKKLAKRNVGRPLIPLTEADWKNINSYLQSQCDGRAIARMFGMHPDSFYAKVVEKYSQSHNISNFSEYMAIKRREGLELLKRKQFDSAMSGNITMQIWLGKQLLAQRDQIEQTITVPQVNITPMTEAEQLEISNAMIIIDNEGNRDIHKEPEGGSGE